MLNEFEMASLERLVDSYSLAAVLEALARIASEKEEHLRVNWQDENSARIWSRAQTRVQKAALAIKV